MSCTLKSIASIPDLSKICKILTPSNFADDGVPTLPEDCLTAISPLADTLVLARFHIVCVLSSEWSSSESNDQKLNFHLSWSRNICHNDKETITSVLVLPVAAINSKSRKVESASPDWSCIAIGFSSGHIRFYNEDGDLLLSHLLHNEPLTRLKCQSFTSARHMAQPEQQEELHAFHTNVICVLPGFPLFNTLKASRNQILRVNADGDSVCGQVTDTPLTFHKWRFTDQNKVSDCIVVGTAPSNTYHHLLTATLCGGFETQYKTSAPQCTLVVASGSRPFIGYHFAMEGSGQLILTDVAKVVANKLKSALGQAVPSWFLGSYRQSASAEVATPPVEPAEDMGCRFGLCDSSRQGIDIVLSPLKSTFVVTDFLGRVSLVDTCSGVIVRLWKGYRDAQCGWLSVEEESSKSKLSKRTALFLVVYAPKRNLIDVWTMQQGPKVATFEQIEAGRLLYTSHGLMGISGPVRQRGHYPVLFLTNNGNLVEISVPFHCALTENNSVKARDLHLLKKLRSTLREHSHNEAKLMQEVTEIASQFSTALIIKEALIHLTNVAILSPPLLSVFLHNVKTESCESLTGVVSRVQHLVQFYEFISSIHNIPPQYTCVVNNVEPHDIEELSKKLFVSKKELTRMVDIIKSSLSNDSSGKSKSVTFSSSFNEYLSTFNTMQETKVRLNSECSEEHLIGVSNLIFQGVVYGSCSLGDFVEACQASQILEEDLIHLALTYWSNKSHGSNIYQEMIHFSNVLRSICTMKGECDEDLWKSIRDQLSECSNPLSAMTGALVCRGVAAHNKKIDQLDDDIDWDTYDQNSCEWSLLIGQLEDISILDKIIAGHLLLRAPYALPCEKPNVTLEYILKNGRGCITELVARWLCACGFNPEFVEDKFDVEFKKQESVQYDQKNRITGVAEGVKPTIEESCEAKSMSPDELSISERLKCLKQHFPYSLTCSSLLAYMAWEYQLAFEKNPSRLEYLEGALEALEKIPSSHIKQGVCYSMWSSHLQIKFDSCIRLLHKVGKLPKELLCKQDLNLSDSQIGPFLKLLLRFFDCYIHATMMAEATERIKIQYELFWEGRKRLTPTFVQQCLTQPPANYELLHLLLQTTQAFHIMVVFDLKISKPLNSFFDSATQAAIFTEIHSKSSISRITPSPKLTETRTKFLLKALSAAVAVLDAEGCEAYEKSKHWIGQLMTLASEWGVVGDILRRHQVCQLYLIGQDQFAQEITSLVSDTSVLGAQLLLIVGMRLNQILLKSKNEKLKHTLSCLSPTVFSWLKTIKPPEYIVVDITRLESILELSRVVFSLLPEDHMAELLAECLPQLVSSVQER